VDCRVLRLSRQKRPATGASSATVTDVDGDLAADSTWDRVVEADVVFHLAAQTSSAVAAANPERDFAANVLPTQRLLAACRRNHCSPTVVFAGTVTAAGVPSRLPITEEAPDDPLTVYDRHKLIAEGELKAANHDGVVKGAVLRLANVYGPGGHGDRADRDVLNRMIRQAMQGEGLSVFAPGSFLRDYVFIDDVVEAFLSAGAHPAVVSGRHFVIGSGHGVTIREAFELVAARVEALLGIRVGVDLVSAGTLSPIERRNCIADSTCFSQATGWRPQWMLPDGIDRTIEAWRCA